MKSPDAPGYAQPNICIVSGEMSGDMVGAALTDEIRKLFPEANVWGVGSSRMSAAGVELVFDSSTWGAISIVEALRLYPKLRFGAFPHIVREILRRKPDVLILIDFGAFNVKVASRCKPRGIPVFYYFPPGSWKKNGRANPQIAKVTNKIATPFPWSVDRYRDVGADCEFVGHPLLDLAQPKMTRAQFAERFDMEPGKFIVGLLPGSRSFEAEYNMPAMLDAARLIYKELPETQFVIGIASPKVREIVEAAVNSAVRDQPATITRLKDQLRDMFNPPRPQMVTPEGFTVSPDDNRPPSRSGGESQTVRSGAAKLPMPSVILAEGMAHDVMAHSDAAVVCSGTATLEAALLGTPMTIIYRGSKLMNLEAVIRRKKSLTIGMPNIMAGKMIVPELLQEAASPESIAKNVLKQLREPDIRSTMKAELSAVRSQLGEPGASKRAAQMALELAGFM